MSNIKYGSGNIERYTTMSDFGMYGYSPTIPNIDMRPYYSSIYNQPTVTPLSLKDKTGIKDIIFNGPATIIFWTDGTKTVMKCMKKDMYDPEKAILMAYFRKKTGLSKTQTKKVLNDLVTKGEL